jgi:hypothetical protein
MNFILEDMFHNAYYDEKIKKTIIYGLSKFMNIPGIQIVNSGSIQHNPVILEYASRAAETVYETENTCNDLKIEYFKKFVEAYIERDPSVQNKIITYIFHARILIMD